MSPKRLSATKSAGLSQDIARKRNIGFGIQVEYSAGPNRTDLSLGRQPDEIPEAFLFHTVFRHYSIGLVLVLLALMSIGLIGITIERSCPSCRRDGLMGDALVPASHNVSALILLLTSAAAGSYFMSMLILFRATGNENHC